MNEISQRQCPEGSIPYTIREGDTPYDIAQRYDTTIEAIMNANPDIEAESLSIGETICIPARASSIVCPRGSRRYTIKPGDTLGGLAYRFNTRVEDILRLNPDIDPRGLRIGQHLCIPTMAPPTRCPEGSRPYIIKQGDMLYDIGQRFGISVEDILSANPGVNPDRLVIGERICIPRLERGNTERQQPSEYVSDKEPTIYTMEKEEEYINYED